MINKNTLKKELKEELTKSLNHTLNINFDLNQLGLKLNPIEGNLISILSINNEDTFLDILSKLYSSTIKLSFTSDSYISTYGMNDDNVKFFKSCARYLLGADSSASVEVPTRGISDYALDGEKVTETSSTVVLAVFMISIPLVFLVAAAFVYEKRKNL